MRLSADSHRRVERFLREHLGEPGLVLPPIEIYAGRFARWVTKALKVGAVTFGRHILFSPHKLVRDEAGRLVAPGWLVAHEALHVVQFEREGHARFLWGYVSEFWRLLRAGGAWGAEARNAAYLAISKELEAVEAQRAYRMWSEQSGKAVEADRNG
ncbi:MAG TPA: DUF4157 domain-containing protein [Pyrinomonadaceae bacterium]|nr:DUF4157 domain-containing protein [Pyrinomonadaceae bacterium]